MFNENNIVQILRDKISKKDKNPSSALIVCCFLYVYLAKNMWALPYNTFQYPLMGLILKVTPFVIILIIMVVEFFRALLPE